MIIVASKNLGFLGGMPFNAPTIITETSNRPGAANSVKTATNHTHERQTSASPWSFEGCRIFLILPKISPCSSTSPIKSLLRGNLVPAHSPSFRSHPRSSGSLQLVQKLVKIFDAGWASKISHVLSVFCTFKDLTWFDPFVLVVNHFQMNLTSKRYVGSNITTLWTSAECWALSANYHP